MCTKFLSLKLDLIEISVYRYNCESDVWSCAWDADDPVYFYGGLKTGEVYVYDVRVTSRYVYQLPRFGARTPVVSIQYLRSPVSASPRLAFSCIPHSCIN